MKNLTINGIAIKLITVAVFIAISIACSKDDSPTVVPGKSDYNNLTSFSIKKSDNPGLTEDCISSLAGDVLLVTVPVGTPITSLKPDITISPKATLTINGSAVIGGAVPALNFTGVVKITVTSESGKSRSLKVLVKPGHKKIDDFIYEFMARYSIPGIGFALSMNEQTIYESGAGFSIVENDVRARPDHLFRLASISKQFTTLCIMKLYEQGKFTVDSKVFGPGGLLEEEFPSVKATDKAARVSIRHFLSHTSGWTSDPDPMFTSSFKGQTLDQRISYMLGTTQGEPGAVYSYYNLGFGVLGKIVEKYSGKKFEVYMKEVLATMGVKDIHVGGDRSQRRANEAVYYSQDGTNGYGNEMDVIAAAGGIIASPSEMLKVLYHIDGLPGIPDILTPETRAIMLKKIDVYDRYALGWRTNHRLFPGASFHTGNLAGTATFWVMGSQAEPSAPKFNCVILCNSRSYISGFDDEMYYLMNNVITAAQSMTW